METKRDEAQCSTKIEIEEAECIKRVETERGAEAESFVKIEIDDAETSEGGLDDVVRSIKLIPWNDIRRRDKIKKGLQNKSIFVGELISEKLEVVVKEIRPNDFDKEYFPGPLCREVYVAAKLRHDNIVKFLGVATDVNDIKKANQLNNSVMEFLPGEHLLSIIKADAEFAVLPWRSRILIAQQIAWAMEYMHYESVVHFDLKSENVLLDLTDPAKPLAKVGDFGLSYFWNEDMSWMSCYGFIGCRAPEMVDKHMGSKISEKADVYMFGVILYELLAGKETLNEDFNETYSHVWYKYLRNEGRHPTVPEWCYHHWRSLMRDCLAVEPSERPDFVMVASRLGDILANLDETISDPAIKITGVDQIERPTNLPPRYSYDLSPEDASYFFPKMKTKAKKGLRQSVKNRFKKLKTKTMGVIKKWKNHFTCRIRVVADHEGSSSTLDESYIRGLSLGFS